LTSTPAISKTAVSDQRSPTSFSDSHETVWQEVRRTTIAESPCLCPQPACAWPLNCWEHRGCEHGETLTPVKLGIESRISRTQALMGPPHLIPSFLSPLPIRFSRSFRSFARRAPFLPSKRQCPHARCRIAFVNVSVRFFACR
jgi:hypothetical protein